jgi:anti-sigma B factor antagonist
VAYSIHIINYAKLANDKIDYDSIIVAIALGKIADLNNSRSLRVLLETLINGGARKIMLDFTPVEQIDSAAIGIIINATKLMRSHKGDIVMMNVSEKINDVFKVINLQRFINMFASEAEVISFFRTI